MLLAGNTFCDAKFKRDLRGDLFEFKLGQLYSGNQSLNFNITWQDLQFPRNPNYIYQKRNVNLALTYSFKKFGCGIQIDREIYNNFET